ncbi:glycosyltransferase family 2 protein [Coprobacter sp.]
MQFAPIALFVYNRLQHVQCCIESLRKNFLSGESELFIFSDGAKSPDQEENVFAVRKYIHNIKGFKQLHIIECAENKGLAFSIISGVTDLVNRYGKIIVLEDDLVVSPWFLTFMNDALEIYKDEENVVNINGHLLKGKEPFPETFLLSFANSWGWGTWKRGWDLFETDGNKLLSELKNRNMTREFDFGGAYHFTRMLKEQIEGKNNSWAIRWNASVFLNNKLSLNAGRSLVANNGFDGTGTHCDKYELFTTDLYTGQVKVEKLPFLVENKSARMMLGRIYRFDNSYYNKIRVRILNFLHR